MSQKISISLPEERLIAPLEGDRDLDIIFWDMQSEAPRQKIDIVVPPYVYDPKPLSRLHGLDVQLVQWQSIGFDGVKEILPQGVVFANATSVHETSTAELALGLTIASLRGIDKAVRSAEKEEWNAGFRMSLADRRVLILGYGGVSKAIEKRLMPFEVSITRVASTAREEIDSSGSPVHVHSIDELPELLKEAEVVIIGLPLNDKTRGLFNEQMLAMLQDGALIVNVGRGPIIDTDALMEELYAERIIAALDVVDPEPLPAGHRLWQAPGLILTPHLGGDTSAMIPRLADLIKRQVENIRAGRPFENQITF